jgi:hypothetical protein
MLKNLNLGAGFHLKSGYLNTDSDPRTNCESIFDLENFPWPLPSDYFHKIELSHVLEHLNKTEQVLKEIYRVCAVNGIVEIRVPHASRGFTHWDHKRGFDVSFPLYFRSDISGGFTDLPFEHLQTKLTWFAQPHYKKQFMGPISYFLGKSFGALFDIVGNFNHFFTSRILCYYVGGYDEVMFLLKKNK